MSTFWEVTIRETGPDWVDLEVVRTHPDAGAFPEDPVFALCLLTEEAYKYEPTLGYNPIPRCPLGEAISYDQSYQPFVVAPRVHEFVCRVLIYETHNVPWDEATDK